MISSGAETPSGKPVGEAEAAEPEVVGEAMTNGIEGIVRIVSNGSDRQYGVHWS